VLVRKLALKNFRNYELATAQLVPSRNILIGENAQGKTNFLEAIELLANGYSDRAVHDAELIRKGEESLEIEVDFQSAGNEEKLFLQLKRSKKARLTHDGEGPTEKLIKVNGVSYALMKKLRGRLVTVSFKSQDLNLLRGGPKFRRDWVDRIAVSLKPSSQEIYAKYHKVITQRNKLLKSLFERGTVSTQAREELVVWDAQAAKYGAAISRRRIVVLSALLSKASEFQRVISGAQELLEIGYLLKKSDHQQISDDDFGRYHTEQDSATPAGEGSGHKPLGLLNISEGCEDYLETSEEKISQTLMQSFRDSRFEEISRRQTLSGPHRDDVTFKLNGKDATLYASQGQQRSLVLSLKLAELKHLTEHLDEPPVLILDDVLAELDLNRQALLMSLVNDDMQTIISTTHLSGFRPEWLEGANILSVHNGQLEKPSENFLMGV
jgi:DNA replication and repair protein RecF